jgi:hypothetical protein
MQETDMRSILGLMVAAFLLAGCVDLVGDRITRWHLTETRFESNMKNRLNFAQIKDRYGRPLRIIRGGDIFIGLWRSPYKFLNMELTGGPDMKCWCGLWEYRFTFLTRGQKVVGFRREMIKKRFCLRSRHQKDPCAGCCKRP